ncbi:MAG: transcription-repair coupling factor, partial [Roseimicrobium sp.]
MPEPSLEPTHAAVSLGRELVKRVHDTKAFKTTLRQLSERAPIVLDHLAREAFPFAAAVAVQALAKRRIWLVCHDPRLQEVVHGELHLWGVAALFFPRMAKSDTTGALADPDTQAERISALARFAEGGEQPRVLVLCESSLSDEVAALSALESAKMLLHTGMKLNVEAFVAELEAAAYERVPQVFERGQFSRRGGIVDVFSWQGEEPLRVEFFDDEVESLRVFDIHTQSSVQRFERVSLLLPQVDSTECTARLHSLITKNDALIFVEFDPTVAAQRWQEGDASHHPSAPQVFLTSGAAAAEGEENFSTAIFESPLGMFEAGDFVLHEARRAQFTKQIEQWHADGWRIVMF